MNLATLAAALNAAGTTLSEAGALPALVVPDQPPPTRHVDCRCTARKVPRAAEQEPVVLPPSKRAARATAALNSPGRFE